MKGCIRLSSLKFKICLFWISILIIASSILTTELSAQGKSPIKSQTNHWQDVSEMSLMAEGVVGERRIVPQTYRTVNIDIADLKSILSTAPSLTETTLSAKSNDKLVVTFPLPDGSFSDFRVYTTQTMEQTLADKYPMIKTYAGVCTTDPSMRIRFDVSHKGLNALIRSPKQTIEISPYATQEQENYMVYHSKDVAREAFQCLTQDNPEFSSESSDKHNNPEFKTDFGDDQLRTYKIAIATTYEFTQYHGGTVEDGLAAIASSMNYVNSLYENDLGIHFNLVADNDLIVYTTSLDPYENEDLSEMLEQNQDNLDDVIGPSNYDVGHVFSTTQGGIGYVLGVCNYDKAKGASGYGNPTGNVFALGIVAHELGHQFGAQHSFNSDCDGNNQPNSGVEPGGGSTIMAYAGSCWPHSPYPQDFVDYYFHGLSIQQIKNYTVHGRADGCAEKSNSGNEMPTADAGYDYVIPISTPFTLTGVATDANSEDYISYCWEQFDNESAIMPPLPFNAVGPMFRSELPSLLPSRTLPRMDDLVANITSGWETLPSVGRTFNFQLTVRDNHLVGGGATAKDKMVVKTAAGIGPFKVNVPNFNSIFWDAGSTQTIEWAVANTTESPVNCASVDIYLSTDGGYTYPHLLAENVENDGEHNVVIPNLPGTLNRVKVACATNIFFDISNSNFDILANNPTFLINVVEQTQLACSNNAGSVVYNLTTEGVAGFGENIQLSVTGLPAGSTATFSSNSVAPGESATLIIDNLQSANGVYDLVLSASTSTLNRTQNLELIVNNPSPVALLSPADGASDVPVTTVFAWDDLNGTNSYSIDIASDAGFSNILESADNITGNFYDPNIVIEDNTTYYWRMFSENDCAVGPASQTFSFETGDVTYCEVSANSEENWIDAVTFGDIHINSGNNNGYQDYTIASTDVVAGSNYPIALTPGFLDSQWGVYWRVWIDFNRNGDFNDAGELVWDPGFPDAGTVNGTIAIPSNATSGKTRMRVSMQWETPQEPCDDLDYGEIEDYTIDVLANGSPCPDLDGDSVCDVDDICNGGDDLVDTNNNGLPDDCEPVRVSLKVFLEGAFEENTGQMNNSLNTMNLLPLNHPYTDPNTYNYTTNASLNTVPLQMVDWVYVETRSGVNSSDFLQHKVGLLMQNGQIKDLDGISDLVFDLDIDQEVYFVVRHLNHLDVMTAEPLVRTLNMSYDFTTATSQAFYGVQKQLPSGVAAMVAGDINNSMDIQNSDYDVWKSNPAQLDVYDKADLNLDGTIQVTDKDIWFINRSVNGPSELAF